MCFPYHSRHPSRLFATRSPTLHFRFASRSLPCPGASAALPISSHRADHIATSCSTDGPSGPGPPRARARFTRRGSALSCDTRPPRPQHVAESPTLRTCVPAPYRSTATPIGFAATISRACLMSCAMMMPELVSYVYDVSLPFSSSTL